MSAPSCPGIKRHYGVGDLLCSRSLVRCRRPLLSVDVCSRLASRLFKLFFLEVRNERKLHLSRWYPGRHVIEHKIQQPECVCFFAVYSITVFLLARLLPVSPDWCCNVEQEKRRVAEHKGRQTGTCKCVSIHFSRSLFVEYNLKRVALRAIVAGLVWKQLKRKKVAAETWQCFAGADCCRGVFLFSLERWGSARNEIFPRA